RRASRRSGRAWLAWTPPCARSRAESPARRRAMKIEGSREIPAPRPRVWEAFLDPGTLAQAIPGCDKLEEAGPGGYKATMKIGVGPVKGTFEGKVRLKDLEPPNRYRMEVEGTGGPGFVRGAASMELSDADGGTRVTYDADIQVGGLIA